MLQTADRTTPLAKDRLRLWLRLLKVQSAIEAEVRRRLRDEFGTTLPRFDVLSALSRHPAGLTMSDISNLLKVSNGNVTGIVEKLVQEGFAVRVAVPEDRRAQRVRLTDHGAAFFANMASIHAGWIDDMLACSDAAEIETLGGELGKIADHLEARHAQ